MTCTRIAQTKIKSYALVGYLIIFYFCRGDVCLRRDFFIMTARKQDRKNARAIANEFKYRRVDKYRKATIGVGAAGAAGAAGANLGARRPKKNGAK